MSRTTLACLALYCALAAQPSFAAPILTVTPDGLSGGNRQWFVDVTPDPAQLPGSMAVELAFAIDSSDLLGVTVNSAVWDTENPGNNPFTGTVTDGLWLDLIGDRTFGAFGSLVFTTPNPARLFTISTQGSGATTIRYGTAASGNANLGNIIAVQGQTFRYSGSSSVVPEPGTVALALIALMGCVAARRGRSIG